MSNLKAEMMDCTLIRGREQGPRTPIPDPAPKIGLKVHYNHVGTLKEDEWVKQPEVSDDVGELLEKAAEFGRTPPQPMWKNSGAGPKWRFPGRDEYVWDGREEYLGMVPENLTQQHIRTGGLDGEESGEDIWGGKGYKEWTMRSALSGQRVQGNTGFGCYESLYETSEPGAESLSEPSSKQGMDFSIDKFNWGSVSSMKFQALKRDEES